MASSESNTFEGESSTTITESVNMPIETTTETETETATETTATSTVELEVDNKTVLNSNEATSRSASYRAVRLSQSDNGDEADEEDPWWSEVENSDLLLDQVPNVTSVFTPSPEAILERSISESESESILKDDNFDRLHKIADKIKSHFNEHAKNKELEELQAKERKISETKEKETPTANVTSPTTTTTTSATENKEQSLEEFKEELRTKRLQRQNAVQDLRDEINALRQQLQQEREINRRLRRGEHVEEHSSTSSSLTTGACALSAVDNDEYPLARSRHANIELAEAQLALQMAQSENIELRGELAVVQKQVVTLKEVIACCKQMLAVKEEQCNELKQRLSEIEKSFAEHEMKIMSDNLRQEYERQLLNIRQLKQLYEERQRVAAAEYENLQRLISIKRDELAQEQEKSKALEERNENLSKEIDAANNELACLRDECKEHKFEKAALKEEIGAVIR
ncbi:hypothetical protein DOY81_008234 [Sarcophaga bullata]|nr:hypothetical protein DOY81_008234 [Sarcophaga bullata]